MISCAVCNEYCFGRLCTECTLFRHAMTLYGKKTVIESVNKIFKRNAQGIERLQGKLLSDAAKEAADRVPQKES